MMWPRLRRGLRQTRLSAELATPVVRAERGKERGLGHGRRQRIQHAGSARPDFSPKLPVLVAANPNRAARLLTPRGLRRTVYPVDTRILGTT